ncbi:hypothetical protein [uncultured Algoriphagus sp.]|uniref:hypothetical protein n=1 Tax=uncultured Algoriphagus sp. TaxID=417365 RepID=UPI0030EE8931|tara:strand:- start:406 stop:642 length:237 start_codon:yes stop_codon:yes gene_type:complete
MTENLNINNADFLREQLRKIREEKERLLKKIDDGISANGGSSVVKYYGGFSSINGNEYTFDELFPPEVDKEEDSVLTV